MKTGDYVTVYFADFYDNNKGSKYNIRKFCGVIANEHYNAYHFATGIDRRRLMELCYELNSELKETYLIILNEKNLFTNKQKLVNCEYNYLYTAFHSNPNQMIIRYNRFVIIEKKYIKK